MEQRSVLIVGSGVEAWLVAAVLDAAVNTDDCRAARIAVLEPPDRRDESGAEALDPRIRRLLALLGGDESAFLRAAGGTFRQATRLVDWLYAGDGGFFMPFERRRLEPVDDAALRWLRSDRSIPFAFTVSAQPAFCERRLGPAPVPLDATAEARYAYHVDRARFSDFLKDLALGQGVDRQAGEVARVSLNSDGTIAAVETTGGASLSADLFIDCSGEAAVLIGEALGVDWVDRSDWLPNDRMLTLAVPWERRYPGHVRPYSVTRAAAAGWIAETPLLDRREWAYACAGAVLDADAAGRELRDFAGDGAADAELRETALRAGYRARSWVGNCVAIGGAAAMLEPLALSGITMSRYAVLLLAEHFPYRAETAALASRFNRLAADAFHEALDFTNLYYALSRREGDYWSQARSRVRERNRARLDYWRKRPPTEADFEDAVFPGEEPARLPDLAFPGDDRPPVYGAELFRLADYEFLLYGMDFLREECDAWFGRNRPPPAVLDAVAGQVRGNLGRLLQHDALLRQVCDMPVYAVS